MTALDLRGLWVRPGSGDAILDGVELVVGRGETVAIFGPSGAGKSTLLRALFDRGALESDGFEVSIGKLDADAELALVPQRGAPFDHLDVGGNLRLALRHGTEPSENETERVRSLLEDVGLDPSWAKKRRASSALSGGQAQRLAVARALASGRRIVFFDEPSVGLDPLRVEQLAVQLARLGDADASVVVVTHDMDFAAAFADRALLLEDGKLRELAVPAREGETRSPVARQSFRRIVEDALPDEVPRRRHGALRRRGRRLFASFEVLARAPIGAFASLRHPRDALQVFGYALRQGLLRPWAFYLAVAVLLGFTVQYVLATFGGELGPAEALRVVRGLPMLALTPPLTGILFVAASSGAVNAWLGGMRYSQQISALEALGIRRERYLWGPSFWALSLSFVVCALTFGAGFLLGGYLLCELYQVEGAWTLLTSDVLDPTPERAPYRVRAAALVVVYAVGIAADAIAKADAPKPSSDAVTRAMTRSVVASTIWIACWELFSLWVVRSVS